MELNHCKHIWRNQKRKTFTDLVTDGTHVVQPLQLLLVGLRQTLNLMHGRAPFHKHRPASTCVTPYVKVSMDAHHDRTDGAATLKHQYPGAVEEQEDAKAELDRVPKRTDVVNVVIQTLPEGLAPRIQQEERVD